MRLGQRVLARIAVVGLLAGSLVAVIPGPAHAAVLTDRACADPIYSGDVVRRLDVCVRGWVSSDERVTRGVVEMHTYAWDSGAHQWVDSRSRSITLEVATIEFGGPASYPWPTGDWVYLGAWGQQRAGWGQEPGTSCRVNGPGGSVGCSVPSTYRVAFYSPAINSFDIVTYVTVVYRVSWRDDRGVAHRDVPVFRPGRGLPLASPVWFG